MSPSFPEIRHLEEITLTAWPALQAVYDDGWVLRLAEGYTRRANSVNPLYASADNLDAKIARCEALYSARGLPTVFKLTPASQSLDEILAVRGYNAEAHTSVQTLDLTGLNFDTHRSVSIDDSLTDTWLNAFSRLNNVNSRFIPVMQRLLSSIVPATAFTSIRLDGEIAAVGLGVFDRDYVGFFDIVTDVRHRQQGLGRRIMSSLLHWGVACGAQHAYLQVMKNNLPALKLYASLGFHEFYPYWYRVK